MKKSIIAILVLMAISFNMSAGGLGSSMGIIDPFARHMCVHYNDVTGEMDDYGHVRDFYSGCEIFLHNPHPKSGQQATQTTPTPVNEQSNVIFEGDEWIYGLFPQATHNKDSPIDHNCGFGLRYNPEDPPGS